MDSSCQISDADAVCDIAARLCPHKKQAASTSAGEHVIVGSFSSLWFVWKAKDASKFTGLTHFLSFRTLTLYRYEAVRQEFRE